MHSPADISADGCALQRINTYLLGADLRVEDDCGYGYEEYILNDAAQTHHLRVRGGGRGVRK
jgi:hypothetical protein